MSSSPPPPPRPRGATRRDAPLWRQAIEGIGLVVVLATIVITAGLLLSWLVSLIF